MTNLVITGASVVAGSNATRDSGIAGEAITPGAAIYLASATNKWMLADSNAATAEARTAKAIALNGAALNQPIALQKSGDITIGATLVPGTAYYLSDTPGALCPVADIGTGEFVCLVGLAKSTTLLALDFNYTGVTL